MTEKGLFGFWFCLLVVFFLVQPGLAQNFDPEQCLTSANYSLIRLPESKDETSCRQDCIAEPGCHMALVSRLLNGSVQCLLVNCLNRGPHSQPRDPSAQISDVYPNVRDDDLCYLPVEYGMRPPIRFSTDPPASQQSHIPNFIFYNGNIFRTVEECESLCGDVKDFANSGRGQSTVATTHQPAVDSVATTHQPADPVATMHQPAVDSVATTHQPAVDSDDSAPVIIIWAVVLVIVGVLFIIFVIIIWMHCEGWCPCSSGYSPLPREE
ncbi:hypothetical protein VZT92_020285 [Zoarces viviparus]|uniref:Apple domain-containing protein n=1 Tax=Zoarces viviparus TaxID=48416 RepID=A0AAW1ECX9_ZOAVI